MISLIQIRYGINVNRNVKETREHIGAINQHILYIRINIVISTLVLDIVLYR